MALLIGKFYSIPGFVDFFIFPEWAPYFIAGASFYLIHHEGLDLYKTLLITVSCVLAILNAIDLLNILAEKYNTYYSSMVVTACIVSFYMFFFLMSLGKTKLISRKSFVFLGALTYPLYLIHQNIGYIFFYHFPDEDYKYLTLAIMVMLALLISYLINTHIENRYGRKFKMTLEKYVSFFNRKTKLAQKS
jgi:peptidoglycan/LPS O-acetylase OafA/YrhL